MNSCYLYESPDNRWVGQSDGPGRRQLASGTVDFGLRLNGLNSCAMRSVTLARQRGLPAGGRPELAAQA